MKAIRFPLYNYPAPILQFQIMSVESQKAQKQLAYLHKQNQQLHTKKSQYLLQKLQSMMNDQGEADLLQHVHLADAADFFKETLAWKRAQVASWAQGQEEIEVQMIGELRGEREVLEEKRRGLEAEIEVIRERKNRYELAEKDTTRKIALLEQRLLSKTLELDINKKQGDKELSQSLSFAYEKQANGSIQFKNSYREIIKHFLKRIQQNEEIINTLEGSVKARVRNSQEVSAKIDRFKLLNDEYEDTKRNVQNLKAQCESLKDEIRDRVEEADLEINRRLPDQIDRTISPLANTRHNYENAYHSLMEIVGKVVDNADMARVTDYISQL